MARVTQKISFTLDFEIEYDEDNGHPFAMNYGLEVVEETGADQLLKLEIENSLHPLCQEYGMILTVAEIDPE